LINNQRGNYEKHSRDGRHRTVWESDEMSDRAIKIIIGAITILPIWLGLWAGSFLVMIKLWEAL